MLLAGQKSGIVYALDPRRQGEILWQTRVGEGGTNGGVQWGMATDGERVFATVSDVGRKRQDGNPLDTRRYVLDPQQGGGLTALRVADGNRLWHVPAAPCPEGAPAGCSPAQPGAVTQIPGVVFATSNDGYVARTRPTMARFCGSSTPSASSPRSTARPRAEGSIDGPGPVIADGMVFVNSGYPRNGGIPGNVLLAFGVD